MVVGAGQMGAGIAEVFAAKGFRVLLHDQSKETTERGKLGIEGRLGKLVKKGYANEEDVASTLKRIEPVFQLSEAARAELVIEAATENGEIKKEIFKAIDEFAPEGRLWRRIRPLYL